VGDIDKDSFMAAVVHDLRAPLNACLMSVSLIEMKAAQHAEVLRTVEVIRRNLERQAVLVGDLSDALQIVGPGLELKPERIDVKETVDAALEVVPLPKGVETRWADAPRGLAVVADPERLKRAVATLVETVAAGASAGARIELSTAARGDMIRIAVRRTEEAAGAESKAARKQPEMRMSIANEIVAKHGGRLTLGEGAGTIELPRG
jgi:signal transduction histidine kinase